MQITAREIDYLKSADRKCGLSYRSSCRRNSGIELAKSLRDRGLLYLYDRGEKRQQGRYVWRTTEAGKAALKKGPADGQE